jgi:hypothetical protein
MNEALLIQDVKSSIGALAYEKMAAEKNVEII